MVQDINPLTLSFRVKEKEELYLDLVQSESLTQIRVVFALFIFLYSLFALLDPLMVSGHIADIFLRIRFFVVVPFLVLVLFLSFTPLFQKWQNIILFAAFITAGMGIAAMLVLAPDNLSYYGGLFMILYSGFFLIRLNVFWSSIAAWAVMLFFIQGYIQLYGWGGWEFTAIIFFYFFSIIIGMFGSYYVEYFSRCHFLDEYKTKADKASLQKRVAQQFKEISEAQHATILALAKLAESRDNDTGEHVFRVGEYSRLIAENMDEGALDEMKMDRATFVRIIKEASYLHDIGKVGIPDAILNKAGPLDENEFEIMKTHTDIGSETLQVVKKENPENLYINMGIEIARSHHEHYDGKGYPDGLSGKSIPLSARIMTVADVYDALRSRRPYKGSISHERSVEIISRASGTQFDPMVVDAFLRVETEFLRISEKHETQYANGHENEISILCVDA